MGQVYVVVGCNAMQVAFRTTRRIEPLPGFGEFTGTVPDCMLRDTHGKLRDRALVACSIINHDGS